MHKTSISFTSSTGAQEYFWEVYYYLRPRCGQQVAGNESDVGVARADRGQEGGGRGRQGAAADFGVTTRHFRADSSSSGGSRIADSSQRGSSARYCCCEEGISQ